MNKSLIALVILGFAAVANAQLESCFLCNQTSVADTRCIDLEPAILPANCLPTGNNGSCFSRVNQAGFVERGCFSVLTPQDIELCGSDSEVCRTCQGNICNNAVFPPERLRCHICTGGLESNCSATVTGNPTICPRFVANDQCFIARPDGNFERGCASSLASDRCGSNEPCHRCNGNGCNNINYNGAFSISSGTSFVAVIASAILILLK